MTEDKKRIWDVCLGIVAPVVTVIGLLIAVWQFNKGEIDKANLESRLLRDRDTLEYHRQLLLERVSIYRSVADLAGKIAAHEANDGKMRELTESFMAQYWGLMILVEDKEVEKTMVLFHDEILDYQNNRSDIKRIRTRADDLVTACRASMERQRSAGDP